MSRCGIMNEIERAIRFYEGHPDDQYDTLAAEALRQMLARTPEGQNRQPQMTAADALERRLRGHAPEIAKNIMDHNAVLRASMR